MKKKKLAVLVASVFAAGQVQYQAAAASLERAAAAPITFERNMGQFPPDVLFVTRGPHGEIAVRSGDVSIAPTGKPSMQVRLAGANLTPEIEERQPVVTRSNYYGVGARRGSITGVPHFGRLVMKDIYPNVDLALHGSREELEYDFLVAPGADPAAIRLDLSGADDAWIDAEGNLRMHIAGGDLMQRAPVAYQADGDRLVPVPARFELHHTANGLEAGFATAAYDTSRELVIDPVLSFSTFLGSSGGDYGGFMKIDDNGYAHSAKMNAAAGANILAVTKHDPVSGNVLYSTTVHGYYGTRVANLAIRTLGPGDVTYVAGSTWADGPFFDCTPCVNNAGSIGGSGDAYVLSFNTSGVITAGVYIGGSGADEATGITTDSSGNVYVTGNTRSPDFPTTFGSYQNGSDVFVARFPSDLSSMQSMLLGGSGDDTSSAIAVDPAGNIYVGMRSSQPDYPPDRNFAVGDFVAKLGSDGSFLQSTFVGGSGEALSAIELDSASQLIVAGTTISQPGNGLDAFVERLSGPYYFASVGGTGAESVVGLTVAGDSFYLVGRTASTNFPSVAAPLVGASGAGGGDAYVARFGPEGVEFATRFGGTSDDFATSVAIAPSGDIYVMGTTTSSDFPLVNATRTTLAGGSDLFMARLSNEFNFSAATLALTSDGSEGVLRITRTGSLSGSTTVKWTAVNGTATAGTHYGTQGSTTLPSGIATFAPGVGTIDLHIGSSVTGPNTIPIIGAASFASPRSFSIALSLPTGGPAVGSVGSSAVTISQGGSALQLDQAAVNVLENAGTVTVSVKRAAGSGGNPASVNYATANGTALAGTHYTARSGTLTWTTDDFSVKDIVVPIIDNNVANAARNFRVNLSGATGLPITGPTFATVTILDEDNTIALAAASQAATEGAASVTLMVKRTGSPTLPASVNWSSENVTALAGLDFGALGDPTALSGTFNWAAGDLTSRNIVIPLLNDAIPEPSKTFKVNLSGIAGATLGTATTTVTLTDNDNGFAFLSSTYSVTEGQPSVVLTVQRVGPATAATSLSWTTANGTAIAGQDFGMAGNPAQRSGTVSWLAGDVANKTITIPIINDTVVGESPETFTVTLTAITAGYIVGNPGVATVTINDDDLIPESAVGFAQPKYAVIENAGTVTLDVLRVDIGGGFGREAHVNFATLAGTALAASDYVTKSGTLIWPAGDSTTKQITINIVNDTVAEPNEAFKVVLSSPTPGTMLGATAQSTVVILDDDEVFPKHGAIPDGFTTPLGATRGWHVSGDAGAYEGKFALKSDEIGDGETAELAMEGTFAAGNVSFRVRVSSEANFDKLQFYVDGVLKTTWSGVTVTGWQMSPTYPITAGHHLLRWAYLKDASISVGEDHAYIDALVTPTFTP